EGRAGPRTPRWRPEAASSEWSRPASGLRRQLDRGAHLLHRRLRRDARRGVSLMEHLAHDVGRRGQKLGALAAERLERRVGIADQVLLAVHTTAGGGPTLP